MRVYEQTLRYVFIHILCAAGDAGRGGNPPGQVLRGGARLQRHGDGAPRTQPRGPLQLLQ